ncbi:hypothetical protein ASPCAL14595 [Aspergillus calidoustus]|uniref:Rhodopsin domain-containing protein n=1 Tax=Aspergillus calidoustus TaxID=454130 RepID=A0A0U4ZQ79_ASPCI|nr:hypothetical protein ASPCAL14595 [Aspergillus calidoustus]
MSSSNRGWILYAVSYPLLAFSTLVTALRLYTRTRIVKSLGTDDIFNILALLCAATNTALITKSVQAGTGRHIETLTHAQQIESAKYQLLSQGFHVMSTNWGKVSVALFLIRIMAEVKQHTRAMYVGIVLLSVVNVVCVYTIYGQCTPTARAWDGEVPGTCWRAGVQRNYAYFQGSASALSDLILAIYPLFTIKNLQMPPKVKFGLGFVLSLGIIAMIAAIVKTTNLYTLTSAHDRPWTMVPLTAWVAVEQYLIIIAACIPALTPLFNIIIRHRGSKRSRSRSKSGSKSLPLHSHRRKRSAVNAADGHQAYLPFASVGREFVEYPMTWAGSKGGGGRYGSGSVVTGSGRDSGSFVGVEDGGSEVGITSKGHQSVGSAVGVGLGVGEEGGMQGGILRTTEFRIKEVVRYDGVG